MTPTRLFQILSALFITSWLYADYTNGIYALWVFEAVRTVVLFVGVPVVSLASWQWGRA